MDGVQAEPTELDDFGVVEKDVVADVFQHRKKLEDPLVTLETDKAAMEVPAVAAGRIESVLVKVGDKVTDDTVICIVEAMKVMNEIKAETAGTITRILVDDSTPVQYGEPLFEFQPA